MDGHMATRLDELLKAAGEPTRLRLLNLLRTGSICVCDLQKVLEIPQPTISRHLAALRHAGVVQYVRNGTRVIYSLTPASTPQLEALYRLLDKCCPYDEVMQSDLARLKEALRLGKCRLERDDSTGQAAPSQCSSTV
jgi:ArsR family transcriptional regulator